MKRNKHIDKETVLGWSRKIQVIKIGKNGGIVLFLVNGNHEQYFGFIHIIHF